MLVVFVFFTMMKTIKYKKSDVFEYQTSSGTSLAYEYAKQKNKNIINLFDK